MKTNYEMLLFWSLPTNKICPMLCPLLNSPTNLDSIPFVPENGISKALALPAEMDCTKDQIGYLTFSLANKISDYKLHIYLVEDSPFCQLCSALFMYANRLLLLDNLNTTIRCTLNISFPFYLSIFRRSSYAVELSKREMIYNVAELMFIIQLAVGQIE